MGITVKKALELKALQRAQVVGGSQGLDNIIKNISIMEVPEIVKWMNGCEFLITSGYFLKDNTELRNQLIIDLSNKGVAALGIKTGLYLKEIPEDMIDTANIVGLPLIHLPSDLPYMDFMLPLNEIIINDQLYRMKKAEEIYRKLLEIILRGEGIEKICSFLTSSFNNPVLAFNANGEILAGCDTTYQTFSEYIKGADVQAGFCNMWSLEYSDTSSRTKRIKLYNENDDKSAVALAIENKGLLLGYLLLGEENNYIDELDVAVLEHAAAIITIEFTKENALFEAECKLRGEILEDLVEGNFKDENNIYRRAELIKLNLNSPLCVFCFSISDYDKYVVQKNKKDSENILEINNSLLAIIQSNLYNYPGGAMITVRQNCLVGLVKTATKNDLLLLKSILENTANKISSKFSNLKILVGIGRPYYGLKKVKISFEEANDAIRVGKMLQQKSPLFVFEELGPYRFLCELKDSQALKSYYNETLGKIQDHEDQEKLNLMETLYEFVKKEGNIRQTAKSLHVNKNTVSYRIKKIEEILKLDLNNPEIRFNLHLAFKLRTIISC